MGQMGFFDVENRYAALDAKHDPLAKINAVVPWETFRSRLEKVWRKPPDERKSSAGCKPWDAIVMFKGILFRSSSARTSLRSSETVSEGTPSNVSRTDGGRRCRGAMACFQKDVLHFKTAWSIETNKETGTTP